jgi:hypothetical protein
MMQTPIFKTEKEYGRKGKNQNGDFKVFGTEV